MLQANLAAASNAAFTRLRLRGVPMHVRESVAWRSEATTGSFTCARCAICKRIQPLVLPLVWGMSRDARLKPAGRPGRL